MELSFLYELYTRHFSVCTDTRKITDNTIFFALKGPNFNGNKFAEQALEQGAAYAVIDEAEYKKDDRYLLVDDVLTSLQQLANYHRKQLSIPVIGIGGSNGKTTTKELIYAVLSSHFKTYCTQGNLNNHIGVPLTLLAVKPDAEMLIVELGTNQPGDIEELCQIAEPNYGLITNIGKEHLEGFGGLEGVAKEESELYLHLMKNGGTAFVNANDDWLVRMSSRLAGTIKYGYNNPDAEYTAELLKANPNITFKWEGSEVTSALMGSYNMDNIMAALCIGKHFAVPADKVRKAIEAYKPTNNRSQLIKKGDTLIYLDAYNANPSSMELALKNFADSPEKPKLALLGDMFELGSYAEEEHKAIAELAVGLPIDKVVLVGNEFMKLKGSINADFYNTIDEVADQIDSYKNKYGSALVKGSRGMTMEKIVDHF